MTSQEKKINIEMNLDKDTKITFYSFFKNISNLLLITFALIERYQWNHSHSALHICIRKLDLKIAWKQHL